MFNLGQKVLNYILERGILKPGMLENFTFQGILASKNYYKPAKTNTEKFMKSCRKVDTVKLSEYYLSTLGKGLRNLRISSKPKRRKSVMVSSFSPRRKRVVRHQSVKKGSNKKCTRQYLHRLSVDLSSLEKELSVKYSNLEDLGK